MVPELAEVVLPPALEGRVILLASGLDALLRTTPPPTSRIGRRAQAVSSCAAPVSRIPPFDQGSPPHRTSRSRFFFEGIWSKVQMRCKSRPPRVLTVASSLDAFWLCPGSM